MTRKQISELLDQNMSLINRITDIGIWEEKKLVAMPKDHPEYEWKNQEEVVEYLASIQTNLEQAQFELNQLEDKLIEQEVV